MEDRSSTGLQPNVGPSGAGEAPPLLQPTDVSEAPLQAEEDASTGQVQQWNVQWREFLARVRSKEGPGGAAIWLQAKALLSVKPESRQNPRSEHRMTLRVVRIIHVLPLWFQSWLVARGQLHSPEVLDLAEAYSSRQQQSLRQEIQLDDISVRRPMENRSSTGLQPNEGPSGAGEASHLQQPTDVSGAPRWAEEDPWAGQIQRWSVPWRQFLERVRTQVVPEEAAIWHQAMLLFSSKPESHQNPRNKYVLTLRQVCILRVLPVWFQNWLVARGQLHSPEVVDLAEAFSWRPQQSWGRENQVAAGSSSSAVQENPLDLSLKRSAGHKRDSGKERHQAGMLLETENEDTLSVLGSGSQSGQAGSPPEQRMGRSGPCLGGAFLEQGAERGRSGPPKKWMGRSGPCLGGTFQEQGEEKGRSGPPKKWKGASGPFLGGALQEEGAVRGHSSPPKKRIGASGACPGGAFQEQGEEKGCSGPPKKRMGWSVPCLGGALQEQERGHSGPPEQRMGQSVPCLGGALQEQGAERGRSGPPEPRVGRSGPCPGGAFQEQAEETVDRGSATSSSINSEEELSDDDL